MRTSAIICQLVALAIVVVHHGDSNLVKLIRAEGTVLWQIVQAHFVSSRHEMMSNEAASFDFPVVSRSLVQVEVAVERPSLW